MLVLIHGKFLKQNFKLISSSFFLCYSSRTATAVPSSAASTSSSSSSSSSVTTINTQDFISGVAHVRLNRAIEIVIDSIQSLEGAVNNFDQLVFGLIYGRLGTRTEFESIEVIKKTRNKFLDLFINDKNLGYDSFVTYT